ncbi:hypothetical protein BGZ75_007306 [Mortierella antarctica]|nr:hypothetical protein BGZ67_005498 [Mortierella alpina]KAF9981424.1 hypothetical protein BGZ75_007306 [Mortierella antarctica]
MTKHSIIGLACLVLALLASFTANALPTPRESPASQTEPFRFDVKAPQMDTLWLIDSLPTVSWDPTMMPEGSSMDIALLCHEKKQSILLHRYVPTRLGKTLVSVAPTITPGTYSLLLTVFKGRTSTVLGRSLVQSLILVNDEGTDPEDEVLRTVTTTEPTVEASKNVEDKVELSEFSFKKQYQNAVEESEQVLLTHQPLKGNLVLRAPYTVGWTIPKDLENARRVRVNLLLVSSRSHEVAKVLATNIDARVGFQYVFLPEDTPLAQYQIKVEIIGKGRKFSGYTHGFHTSLPAFSARK